MLPEIGDEDMHTLRRARLAALRDKFNARSALSRDHADFISDGTARKIWGLVAKMFADAAHPDAGHADPRDPSSPPLHVRDDDPTEKIRPPDDRGERQAPSLWPKDVAALLSCVHVLVHYLVLYAVAIYLALRQSELRALTVGDVDLENGVVRITHKVSRKTGKLERIKTKKPGWVPIEPALQPLLAALVEGRDAGERLLWMPPEEDLAANLRKHLRLAGIDRAEFFADDATQRPFNFHGCRHTHLTFRAARGDNATELMGSVLHADLVTTMGYIDQGVLHAMRRQKESIFAPLPSELIEAARGGVSPAKTRAERRAAKQGRGPAGSDAGSDKPQRASETPTGSSEDPNGMALRPQRELRRGGRSEAQSTDANERWHGPEDLPGQLRPQRVWYRWKYCSLPEVTRGRRRGKPCAALLPAS